jgi:hypothetical protein
MYHAALRISEIASVPNSEHSLSLSNIQLSSSQLKITLHSFKHSKVPVTIVIEKKDYDICPVRLMSLYLQVRGYSPGLLYKFENGDLLTRDHIMLQLKKSIYAIGLDPKHFNTHSFRIGKTTDMATQGNTSEQICIAGRWSSQAYKKYIKPFDVIL